MLNIGKSGLKKMENFFILLWKDPSTALFHTILWKKLIRALSSNNYFDQVHFESKPD